MPAATFNDYKPKPSAANEEDFMASLLVNLDEKAIRSAPTNNRKRKPREDSSAFSSDAETYDAYRFNDDAYADTSSDGPNDDYLAVSGDDCSHGASRFKKPRKDDPDIIPTVNKLREFTVDTSSVSGDDAFDDIDMDDFAMDEEDIKPQVEKVKMEIDEPSLHASTSQDTKGKALAIDVKKEETPSWLNVHASLKVNTEDSLGPLASTSSGNSGSSKVDVLEKDGSLRFFWIDYLEQEGKVHFIGKLKDKISQQWISCCISVENLQRNLFLLPRERRLGMYQDF